MDDSLLESQVESKKDLAEGERGNAAKVQIWRKEIEFSLEYEKSWRKEASVYLEEYQNEDAARRHIWDNPNTAYPRTYNIFWANTQTLRPLLFSNLPKANVTQRYYDDDELARLVSEMIERAVDYTLDKTDAEDVFEQCRDDYLISGRGVARVVYEPEEIIELEEKEIVINEDGTQTEQAKLDIDKSSKKIRIEFVEHDNVVISTENQWQNLRWIAFRHLMSRENLTDRFGAAKANRVSLAVSIDTRDSEKKNNDANIFKRAVIWEIWDKKERKVIWINETGDEVLLEEIDDPYNLQEFFPVPRFLGCNDNAKNLLPLPLYRFYRSQALELNEIDIRVRALTEQLKFTGLYMSNAESADMSNLMNGDDGVLTPMKKTMGGDDISKMIVFKPIAEIAAVIDKLEQRKLIVLNNIRDITGISDIVRGVTAPNETATAQELKGNFAISRIQPLQKSQEVFIRDVIRLVAELEVEHYSVNELAKVTNLKIVDIEAIAAATQEKLAASMKEGISLLDPNKEDYQQQVQALEEQAKIGFKKTMQKPINDLKGYAAMPDQLKEIDKLIKSDKLRSFTINIETDSTVKVDQQQEKQDRIEFVKAVSSLSSSMFPMVQAGIITEDAFNKFLLFTAAPFKVGRNMQEFLVKGVDEQQEKPPTPEQIKAQSDAQYTQAEIQIKQAQVQLQAQESQRNYELGKEKNNIEKAKVIKEMQEFDDKLEFDDVNLEADRQARTAQDIIKARTAMLSKQIKEFGANASQ